MSFMYQNGQLVLVQGSKTIKIQNLASGLDAPAFIYDLDGISQRLADFEQAFVRPIGLHYAMKANNHFEILKLLADRGLGADVVSGGELQEAMEAGIAAEKIVFSGVGKSRAEIRLAIESKIKQINVESPQELIRISEIAKSMDCIPNVALRMNPDVNPETHPYICTGFRENKFGMDESFLPELIEILSANREAVKLTGMTIHIGSQIHELEPFIEAIEKTLRVYRRLKYQEGFPLVSLDVGGGLGIHYEKHLPDQFSDVERIGLYAKAVEKALGGEDCEILCEPGRILVAPFGILLGEVQYIKSTEFKNFAILNTGMHHLMRPALYQAHHHIASVIEKPGLKMRTYDIVGPICESSDVIGFERHLPELKQDDWVAIFDTGAYGAVMASGYNSHGAPGEIFYSKGVRHKSTI